MAFTVKVKVGVEKNSRLYIERRLVARGDLVIEIPDTYLVNIENARKAEKRATERLGLWIAEKHPDVFEKTCMKALLENG